MTLIPTSAHSLRLVHPTHGTLYLMEDGGPVTHDDGYTLALLADGTDLGNAEQVISSLLSMMADGSLETVERWDNRAPALSIEAHAEDYTALSASDVALARWADGATALEWLPPAGEVWTVFDIFRARLTFQTNDLAERRLKRYWSLSLSAHPHPRSAALVTTPALATGSSSQTSIDTCDSATNWSSTSSAVTAAAGAVYADPDGVSARLTRTGSVDFTTTSYLLVEWSYSITWAFPAFFVTGATQVARIALGSGWYQSTFEMPASVAATIEFGMDTSGGRLYIRDVKRSAGSPSVLTPFQQCREIVVGGSARTQGSLHVYSDAPDPLGVTLVYTGRLGGGYQPPLRRWRTSSDAVTTDATMMSGGRNSLAGMMTFRAPIDSVPRGTSQLWMRARRSDGSGSVRIYHAAYSYLGAVELGADEDNYTDVTFVDDVWTVVPLATYTLPIVQTGPDGLVQINIQRAAGSETVEIDEAWLFAINEGALTVVDCGSGALAAGGPASHLWIDAPSPSIPNGRLAIGTDDEQADAYWPQTVDCDMLHNFDPEGMNVFVASEAEDVLVELEHAVRWHTHAAS